MSAEIKKCIPCSTTLPAMTGEQVEKELNRLSNWTAIGEADSIERRFSFKNFKIALSFANKVGELAELEGHHPLITIGWGFCVINFKTNKIDGLHENDFLMAEKVDEMFDQPDGFKL